MFSINVIHEITFSNETLVVINRVVDLLELNLKVIPELESDLKSAIDPLQTAVENQNKLGEKSNG